MRALIQSALISCIYPLIATTALAAPNITNVSLRGLQIGGTTTLVIEGSELLPDPVLVASFPIASQTVRPNAQPNRVEIDVTTNDQPAPGMGLVRVGSGKGISNAVVIGLDRLVQQPFASEVANLPVALHGAISGTQILSTKFRGSRGQKLVADIEAQRLGANFKPVLRIKDRQGRQIAWSPPMPRLLGDARVAVELPEEGEYTLEVHDVLYRAAAPGFFRLKLGELHYADLAFPLGVQMGSKATVQFAGTNIPPETSVELDVSAAKVIGDAPTPLQSLSKFTGSPPRVIVSAHPELIEKPVPAGQRQELTAIPVAISGRLSQKDEEDQYLLPVTPGSRLRVEVFAQQVGSPVDGVLSLRNEQGAQLAASDDRPGVADPGLDFTVPADLTKLVIAIKDLVNRGGSDFVYRLALTDAARPDFNAVLETDRITIPAGATQVLRVQLNRAGYGGPIQLGVEGLPSQVQLTGQEVPAGASIALLTFTAAPGAPLHGIGRLTAQGTGEHATLIRVARSPEAAISKRLPWLRDELAMSVGEPAPVSIAWTGSNDAPLLLGGKLPLTVALQRAEGVAGNVRLRLLTTQVMPRKKIKENNQDKEVDDLERALRLEGEPMIAADAKQSTVNVLVPADLPAEDWGLVLAADLLGADNKTVIATTTTTLLTKRPTAPPPAEALAIFEDDEKLISVLTKGSGMISLETQDKYSGAAALKVTPDQRFNEIVPTLNVKIREKPGPGEYRFLRFVWKKKGGSSVCFQLNHDGMWGPGGTGKEGAKFRYHAGSGGECYGASLILDEKLPAEYTVVTRDLFADFGEFTFTGLAFSPIDGEYALFDHIYLGRTATALDQVTK